MGTVSGSPRPTGTPMHTRRLGGDGPAMSVIGLGCNNFGMKIDARASAEVVHAAIDAGITHLDTAEMYGAGESERHLGAALGSRRDNVVIATKFSPRPRDEAYVPGLLRRRIIEACEGSLRRLRTDRIDLYYQHYPDPEAPAEEALHALDDLILQGKVLHIASSNVNATQLRASARIAEASTSPRFCGTQLEWNLLSRSAEKELIPAAREEHVDIVPYFPLASGMLTGKYQRGQSYPSGSRFATMPVFARDVVTAENYAQIEMLTAFARERGHTLLDLAIAWLAAQDGVASVIAGATTPEQVQVNAAAGEWKLGTDDLAALI